MKRFRKAAVALTLLASLGLASGGAFAQDHHDGHQQQHHDWKRGGHIEHNDWNRGQHVDYRSHHLRAPPRGYEWRQVDGNFVLAAVATGLIASIIAAQH
jgi:Ni/Co efflux regulator RcnB